MAISYRSVLHDRERTFTVAVDHYGDGQKAGILYHGEDTEGYAFCGYPEMVHRMECFFQQMMYPRPVMDQRVFRVGKAAEEAEETEVPEEHSRRAGRMGTFRIRVTQRQNASWQGTVRQMETGETFSFHSFLELVCWMDGILRGEAYEWPGEQAGPEAHQQRLEHFLQLVMECPETLKIIPDTLVYRFKGENWKRTFMIRPMFYEHHTCQGVLYWKESRKQSNFRSFLELVAMMSEAIRAQGDGEWESQDDAVGM